MNYDKIIFGQRAKQLRINNDESLNDVATALSTTKSVIGNIENARTGISLDMAIAFANHFDVSVDYLLGRTDNPRLNK